jgi:hypothetical protein
VQRRTSCPSAALPAALHCWEAPAGHFSYHPRGSRPCRARQPRGRPSIGQSGCWAAGGGLCWAELQAGHILVRSMFPPAAWHRQAGLAVAIGQQCGQAQDRPRLGLWDSAGDRWGGVCTGVDANLTEFACCKHRQPLKVTTSTICANNCDAPTQLLVAMAEARKGTNAMRRQETTMPQPCTDMIVRINAGKQAAALRNLPGLGHLPLPADSAQAFGAGKPHPANAVCTASSSGLHMPLGVLCTPVPPGTVPCPEPAQPCLLGLAALVAVLNTSACSAGGGRVQGSLAPAPAELVVVIFQSGHIIPIWFYYARRCSFMSLQPTAAAPTAPRHALGLAAAHSSSCTSSVLIHCLQRLIFLPQYSPAFASSASAQQQHSHETARRAWPHTQTSPAGPRCRPLLRPGGAATDAHPCRSHDWWCRQGPVGRS